MLMDRRDVSDLVSRICEKIEEEENVKVLFAVEAGDRAWRLHDEDDKYSVRFVFAHPVKEYIRVEGREKVIQSSYNKEGEEDSGRAALFKFKGYDILKFVRQMVDSRPLVMDWMASDIVYHGRKIKAFKDFAYNEFDKERLYEHFKSVAEKYYSKIKKGKPSYRDYVLALRGVINAKWVERKDSLPPFFSKAVRVQRNYIPKEIYGIIIRVLSKQTRGHEREEKKRIKKLDKYIERFLKKEPELEEREELDLTDLNKCLQDIILGKE